VPFVMQERPFRGSARLLHCMFSKVRFSLMPWESSPKPAHGKARSPCPTRCACSVPLCSDTEVAKLQGRVFIEQRQLNLLGSVLDTPQFFWEVPDAMQNIYDRVRTDGCSLVFLVPIACCSGLIDF
jgi:hypothetical protein